MIKFVLAFIALILVILGIYTYTNQDAKKTVPTSSSVTQKVEVEEKVLPQAHEVKVKKSSTKNLTVKSSKVISYETTQKMEDQKEIGKDFTLEGIENADVSDEEKDRMRDDLAYYQSKNRDAIVSEVEIGKDLTLESIKNANVSNEEKNRMRDDLAYYQIIHSKDSLPLNDEAMMNMIEQDMKSELTQ